jgi:23S rRNA pseudouridine1911/1915/1917 synthase
VKPSSREEGSVVVFINPVPDQRLDHALVDYLAGFSRNRIQHLIRNSHVQVNHTIVSKSGHRLAEGDSIRVLIPEDKPTNLTPEPIPLEILLEDSGLLAVNKPAGMVVHPSSGHSSGTLVHAVLAHAPDLQAIGGEIRPGIVHRLDKDTSGVILVAKNESVLRNLQKQFKQRHIKKTYLGLVDGVVQDAKGVITGLIGRAKRDRKKMAIVVEGKGREARTDYEVMELFTHHSLLKIQPETGRTHQIRVHLAGLGHPIAGDKVYGHRRSTIPVPRHFLHALSLRFQSPTSGNWIHVEAPLPFELEQVLVRLRRES